MNDDLRNHIIELLKKGLRLDGRKPEEYREPIRIEYGVVKTADGSAKATIGNTEVIAGVKMEIGEPYPDKQDEGSIIVGEELLPMSNPDFELGPPGIQGVELARVVDRGIRESKALDFKKLCITEGEKVWIVVIDVCTINDDGNLFDASALAAFAALKDTRLPEVVDDKIDYTSHTDEGLPLVEAPLSITVCKIGDNFIVDPTIEEEKVIDSRLTVASIEDGTLCALQKGGDIPLSKDDIEKMVKISLEKVEELRKSL